MDKLHKWLLVAAVIIIAVVSSGKPTSPTSHSDYVPSLIAVATIKHMEGFEEKPYLLDGKWHIGFGRNISDNGITLDEGNYLFYNDISRSYRELKEIFPEFDSFSEKRQTALLSLIYQLGKPAFLGFTETIAAIRAGDWDTAGDEIMDSQLFNQVPGRTAAIARMIREG